MFGMLKKITQKPDADQRSTRERLQAGVDALTEHVPEDSLERLGNWFAAWAEAIKAVAILAAVFMFVLYSIAKLGNGEHVELVRTYAFLVVVGCTAWAVVRILKGDDEGAAKPVAVIGLLAVAAWPLVILAGGYTGDPERGYVLPLLTLATIVICLTWLVKRDKPVAFVAGVTLALVFVVHVLFGIAGSVSLIRPGALAAALLFGAVAVFAVMTMVIIGRSHGIAMGSIAVGSYLMDWWLFGDPHDSPEVGLTLWQDGRFDQFCFGVVLLAVSWLLWTYVPDEDETPETEEHPEPEPTEVLDIPEETEGGVFHMPPPSDEEPETASAEPGPESEPEKTPESKPDPEVTLKTKHVRKAAERLWSTLDPEHQALCSEFYGCIRDRRILKQDRSGFLKKFLQGRRISSRQLDMYGLTAEKFRIIAADRLERQLVESGHVQPTGSLEPDWQRESDIKNDYLLEELGITPDTLMEAYIHIKG